MSQMNYKTLQEEWLKNHTPTIIATPKPIYVYIDSLGRVVVGNSENRIALQHKRFGTKSNRRRSK